MDDGGFGIWWLLGCFAVFVAGVWWIYRPSAKQRMDDAAQMPFREDD